MLARTEHKGDGMKPTSEQDQVSDRAASLKAGDVLKVIAFAGSGKTTTLKMCAKRRSDRGMYLAFNKAIAEEAKQKLGTTKCGASTMHGLAYGAMRDIMGQPARINARSLMESGLIEKHRPPMIKGWGSYRVSAAVVRTMVAFSNSADEEILPKHAIEALVDSVGDPDFLIGDDAKMKAEEAIRFLVTPLTEIATDYWIKCIEDGAYSHDMYLKMLDLDEGVRQDAFGRLKYLMIDEAQDINPVQRSIVMKTGLPVIAVGDPYQQIYSWRGAENALSLMEGEELYLTQSFRFGEEIAEIARHTLLTRPDGGPSQRLVGLGPGDPDAHTGPKGAIICRTNIGMLDEAMKCLNSGHPVHVDKMDELLADAQSAQALFEGRKDDITSPELRQFDDWEQFEMAAEEGGDPALNKLVRLVRTRRVKEVEELGRRHEKKPDGARLLVCTGHRSKGLEFPAVMMGDDWADVGQLKKRHAKAVEKSEKHVTAANEEFNLLYVAFTRSMLRLRGHQKILFPERNPNLNLNLDQVGDPHEEDRDARPV
jgi:superfamily I DNA/RNA helicase